MEPLMAAPAAALTYDPTDIVGGVVKTTTFTTTCPYCSAQCGQKVVVGDNTKKVYDIYGDANSPTNRGGLCAKGAGSLQLVNNRRRIGVPEHTAAVDGKDMTGEAWKRVGTGSWTALTLQKAMDEIAPKLVAARGAVGAVGDVQNLFTTGESIGGQLYQGFSGYQAIARTDGTWFVTINGNKVTPTVLAGFIATNDTPSLLASFDELIFVADNPAQRATYTFVGKSTLGATLAAASVMPNTAHVVRDDATYYAYVCDVLGAMHVATSTDMLAWAYVSGAGKLGSPENTFGIKTPSVIKSGSDLKVWSTRFNPAGVEDNTLWYSEYTNGEWNTAVALTIGGAATVDFTGHPYVEASATEYTMHYALGGGGIKKAIAPVETPAVFAAGTAVYDNVAASEGNVSAGPAWVGFTTYDFASQPDIPSVGKLGWAYSDVKAVLTVALNNATGVQFFGCSHMNNEQNYTYRKLIANFGTSRVEHQARI
jgi:hypothetical protein